MAIPVYAHTAADGRTYYLHGKTVRGPGGRRQRVYWFARPLSAKMEGDTGGP